MQNELSPNCSKNLSKVDKSRGSTKLDQKIMWTATMALATTLRVAQVKRIQQVIVFIDPHLGCLLISSSRSWVNKLCSWVKFLLYKRLYNEWSSSGFAFLSKPLTTLSTLGSLLFKVSCSPMGSHFIFKFILLSAACTCWGICNKGRDSQYSVDIRSLSMDWITCSIKKWLWTRKMNQEQQLIRYKFE